MLKESNLRKIFSSYQHTWSKTIRKYIWRNKNNKHMLDIKLKRGQYGTLQAAILFWRLFSDTLKE